MQKTLTRIFFTALALLLPLSAEAVGNISANDSIAGLGMTVMVQSAPADAVLSITSPDGKHAKIPVSGNAQALNVSGKYTRVAGTYTLGLEANGKMVAGEITVAVLPGTMDSAISDIQAWTPHIAANGKDAAEITVTLRDAYGNVLAGRPVTLVSSNQDDEITAVTPETGADGVQHFSLRSFSAGTSTVRAVDLLSGNTLMSSADIRTGNTAAMGGDRLVSMGSTDRESGRRFYGQVSTQSFDLIDSFEIIAPLTLPLGEEAPKITIRAIDKSGNIVEDYAGTVTFESTDANATLPNFGTYTFKSRDLGQKSFPLVLKFNTPGDQIFRVKDTSDAGITGEATIKVGGSLQGAAPSGITVTSYKDGDYVSTLNIVIAGTGPKYANLIVMGGAADANGTTDADGKFSIPVTLSATQRDFTIRVRDDAGRNDSGPIHLILDLTPPTVTSITFAPVQPESNEKVLVVVKSDAGLATVTMKIDETSAAIPLLENSAASGSYQGFFTAPAAGSYQPAITTVDKAGNSVDVRTTFTVGAQGLAPVLNVKGEPRVNAVLLQWDAFSDPVDGYRIYVGESMQNFLYTLDTGRVTTKATVAGLTPGKTYFFAVTALKGALESKTKSQVIQAAPLGLMLKVTPGNGALQIKWDSLSTKLPLSSFILEYGVEPDTFTETRTLNGALRDYTMRDLLNGVTYYMRLTAVTVTGDQLRDLAAKGQGAPSGSGFQPGPRDDIPSGIGSHAGGIKNPPPTSPSSGLPTVAWIAAIVLGLLGAFYGYKQQRKHRHAAAFLQTIQRQYRL